jgi:hypothetical protein
VLGKGTCVEASCQLGWSVSEQNSGDSGGAVSATGTVLDIVVDFLGYLTKQSKVGVGRAADRGRHQLELRQLKKDRSRRLEKLGREVIALVSGGELDHPGLSAHMAHIQDLDRKIQTGLTLEAPEAEASSGSGEE